MSEQRQYTPASGLDYFGHMDRGLAYMKDSANTNKQDATFILDLLNAKHNKDTADYYFNMANQSKPKPGEIPKGDPAPKSNGDGGNTYINEPDMSGTGDKEPLIKSKDGKETPLSQWIESNAKVLQDKMSKGNLNEELLGHITHIFNISRYAPGKEKVVKAVQELAKATSEAVSNVYAKSGKGFEESVKRAAKAAKGSIWTKDIPWSTKINVLPEFSGKGLWSGTKKVVGAGMSALPAVFFGMDAYKFYNEKDKSMHTAAPAIISGAELGLQMGSKFATGIGKQALTTGTGGTWNMGLAGAEIAGQVYKYLMDNQDNKELVSTISLTTGQQAQALAKELSAEFQTTPDVLLAFKDANPSEIPADQRGLQLEIQNKFNNLSQRVATEVVSRDPGFKRTSGIGTLTNLYQSYFMDSPEEAIAKSWVERYKGNTEEASKEVGKSARYWNQKAIDDPYDTNAFLTYLEMARTQSVIRSYK